MSLSDGLEKMYNRAIVEMFAYTKTNATKLEGIMKREAPWRNWTGDARKGLMGNGYRENNDFIIKLSIGSNVNYGIFLELAHEKKYAIVMPTIREHSQEVIDSFQNILNNLDS